MAEQGAKRGPWIAFVATIALVAVTFAILFTSPPTSTAIPPSQEGAAPGLLPSSASTAPSSTPTGEANTGASRVTGWMPYWATQASLDAVLANQDLFEAVSPFWFQLVSERGTARVKAYPISGGLTRESVRDQLKQQGIAVIPSIIDDSPPRFLAQQLKSPKKRAALVRHITAIATREGYDGIDLDLENFAFKDGKETWSQTRPVWVSFVRQLSKALKAKSKVLTVTTPPIYNRDYTPSSGYWVYDWESIAPHVHRLRIMTYDYSFDRAGPIGPLDWATRVVEFAKTVVPPRKIEMGAPAYGRNWVTSIQGECPSDAQVSRTYLNMEKAESLAQTRGAVPQWDAAKAEATYSYSLSYAGNTQACTVNRTVWFPTPQSLQARAQVASALGIEGIAIWSLNEVSPGGWAALR